MIRHTLPTLLLILCFSAPLALAEPDIKVKGLFKNAAVLIINGQQKLLKVGGSQVQGVTLVSASSKGAVIEFEGKRINLQLSTNIGADYSEAEKAEVRLTSQHNGHYFGTALFNGRRGHFVVDTGASKIAMSSDTANQLGISYKGGKPISVNTAQGSTRGFLVNINRVELGGIRVDNVATIILEGRYPLEILLGNSFLSQLEMNIENGVLLLQSKY